MTGADLLEDVDLRCAASAILLFGSRARADHDGASDTDLLFICEEVHPRHVSAGKTSMFFYPWKKLLADAEMGDLFVGHIAMEARPLSDPSDMQGRLRNAFKLRSSYKVEIDRASDFGWYISRFPTRLKPSLAAKRMIWCVRTILISRLAEQGRLVFSPKQLAELTESKAVRDLILERRRRRIDEKMQRDFRKFLLVTAERQRWHREESEEFFVQRFKETSNEVALKTLEQNNDFGTPAYD